MSGLRSIQGTLLQRLLIGCVWAFTLTGLHRCTAQSTPPTVPTLLFEHMQEFSWHELSGLRLERGESNQRVLVFDFKTRQFRQLMDEIVVLRIGHQSLGHVLMGALWANNGPNYRLVLDEEATELITEHGAEVYVVGRLNGHHFQLSNSLTIGNTKQQMATRPLTDELLALISKAVERAKQAGPQYQNVPAGFTVLTETRVAPAGMSARVFIQGQWKPAEYLGRDEKSRAVYRPDANSREIGVTEPFNLAVDNEQIQVAWKNLEAFKPSLQLLPESSIVVPEGFVLNINHYRLEPGVPVRIHLDGQFYDGFVTKNSYHLTIRGPFIPGGETELRGTHVMLTPNVLERIRTAASVDEKRAYFAKFISPESTLTPMQAAGRPELEIPAETYAEPNKSDVTTGPEMPLPKQAATPPLPPNPAASQVDVPSTPGPIETSSRKLKSYPIQISLPPKCSPVTRSLPLLPDVQLGCSWANKWYWVTVLQAHSDGAVRIRWNDFGAAWDTDVARSDLIVPDTVKKTLERKSDAENATPRLWKDSTEKFEVVGYFDGIIDENVRLIKVDGSALVLPISKLSERDQQVAQQRSEMP